MWHRVTLKALPAGASIPASCSFILPMEPSWASGSSWGVNHVRVGLKVCAYGLRSIEGQHQDVLQSLVPADSLANLIATSRLNVQRSCVLSDSCGLLATDRCS